MASGGLRLEELLMTIRAEYEGLALNTLDARRGGDEFESIGKLNRVGGATVKGVRLMAARL